MWYNLIAENNKLRIFLSGPMTGYENFNFDQFNFIENVLNRYGIEVVNPVRICKKYKKEHVLNDKAVFDKMVECNGKPVCKLSNNDGKIMCQDNEYVDYLRRTIIWRLKYE